MLNRVLHWLARNSWESFVPEWKDVASGQFEYWQTIFIHVFPLHSFIGWTGWHTVKSLYKAVEFVVWK